LKKNPERCNKEKIGRSDYYLLHLSGQDIFFLTNLKSFKSEIMVEKLQGKILIFDIPKTDI
jgi:hypothetical protein